MPKDLLYAAQRNTIMRYMHRQVNKLYLYEQKHPYLHKPYELRPLYVYRMQELLEILEQCFKKKELPPHVVQRAVFEFATNPHGQMKFLYSDLLTFRTILMEYPAHTEEQTVQQIQSLMACVQNLLPRIPDLMPSPESAVQQRIDMHEVIEWQMHVYTLNIEEIIHRTHRQYLSGILYTRNTCTHKKAPHISDYLMNLDAVIVSSMQQLHEQRFPQKDTAIIYWCCMYLRYCAPGFLDAGTINDDAYRRTDSVLNILHNEWKYLFNKYL